MSVEAAFATVVKGVVDNRLYLVQAPAKCGRPYGVYQSVGGPPPVQFMEGGAAAKRCARIQLTFWHQSAEAAAELSREAEDLVLAAVALQATALGHAVATGKDPETQLHGSRQDFSVWY